jgi:tetratricopeptide (TPR) repeat protein
MSQQLVDEAMDAYRLAHVLMTGKVGEAVGEAIPHLRRAADCWGRALRSQQRAEVLVELGRLHQRRDEHGLAIDAFEEAVRIFRELGQRREAAEAGVAAGLSQKALGKPELALAYLERALAIHRDGGDLIDVAMTAMTLGSVHLDQREPAKALEQYQAALPILERHRKRAEVAHVHEMIGVAHQMAGDAGAAAAAFETAITMKQQQLGDMRGAAKSMSRFADLQRHQGRHDEALALYRRALDVHRLRNDQALIAQTLGNIGTVHAQRGDHASALRHYRECLELSKAAGERAAESQALYNIAGMHLEFGQEGEALAALTTALAVCDELGSRQLSERILAVMADLHAGRGDAVQAEACLRRRADLLAQLGDQPALRRALDDLIGQALAREEWEAVLELERRLLASCDATLAPAERVEHRLRQGTAAARLGDHPAAVEAHTQGLASAEGGADELLARVLRYLGASELQVGASADAWAHYRRAADLHRARDERKALAIALIGVGNAAAQLGRKAEARVALDEAAAIRQSLGDEKGTAAIRKATNSL